VEFKQQKKKSNHVNKGDVTGQFNQHDNKHVKLLTEGLPGIHQRFIPKKRFVCSRESTKRFLRFFPGNDAKKRLFQNYISTITAVKT